MKMKTDRIKCLCPCHKDTNFKHVGPCCENGWIETPQVPDGLTEYGVRMMRKYSKIMNESTDDSVQGEKPDFEAIAKMLHPDSTVERAVFDGPHRLNYDSPAYVRDQWMIETARINVAKALEYFWATHVQTRIAELEAKSSPLKQTKWIEGVGLVEQPRQTIATAGTEINEEELEPDYQDCNKCPNRIFAMINSGMSSEGNEEQITDDATWMEATQTFSILGHVLASKKFLLLRKSSPLEKSEPYWDKLDNPDQKFKEWIGEPEQELRTAEEQQHEAKLIAAVELIKRIHGSDHSKEGHIGYHVAPLRIARLMVQFADEYAAQFKQIAVSSEPKTEKT